MNKIVGALLSIALAVLLVGCKEDTQKTVLSKKDGVFIVAVLKVDHATKIPIGEGMGTGFLVGKNEILTNAHIVVDTAKIMLKLENSPGMYEATVEKIDPLLDIALLKMNDWDTFKKENDYEVLSFADSLTINQLDEVYAIGNPWGLTLSISKGVVSSKVRKNPYDSIGFFIQTDAHVFEGNSGGPLLNTSGEVLGMNSAMIARTGGSYGMTIHGNFIKKVMRDWRAGHEPTFPLVGLGLGDDNVVRALKPGSAAEAAGLKVGDRILAVDVNGDRINVSNGVATTLVLATTNSEDDLTFEVSRAGNRLSRPVHPTYSPLSSQEAN